MKLVRHMTLPAAEARAAMRAAPPFGLTGLVILAIGGCERSAPVASPPAPAVTAAFEEVGAPSGLRFVWHSGHEDRFFMPEIIGGGAALFDMDGDGDLDAYLVQAGGITVPPDERPTNRLLRNLGDGTFEDVTDGSGADDRGFGMGVAAGDYDNDGDVDLYVTNVGPNVLLRNDGGPGPPRFTDVTAGAGVGDPGWGSSAAFLDYDHDGDLDLYVCNYINWSKDTEPVCFNDFGTPDYCLPQNYNAPAIDTLYRNDGDAGFTDVTEAAGLDAYFGTGLGVVCGDFNGDGTTDIFVANDGMRDQLWSNQGDGRFLDIGLTAGCAVDLEGTLKAGMGVTAADVDDDGDLDLLVCNLRHQSDSFFINEGEFFTDATASGGLAAVSRPFTRFGMAWADFNNDGRLDLYQANGRVGRQAVMYSKDPYAEPNLLLIGREALRFEPFELRGGTVEPLIATSRAAAFGDIDNDGGVDVLVVNRDAEAHLLRNVMAKRGHWLIVRVVQEHGRDAYGATVRLSVGERVLTRDVRAAYSYLASNDPRVHIGLGDADRVESVTVQWADGTTDSFGSFAADQIVTLRRPEATGMAGR